MRAMGPGLVTFRPLHRSQHHQFVQNKLTLGWSILNLLESIFCMILAALRKGWSRCKWTNFGRKRVTTSCPAQLFFMYSFEMYLSANVLLSLPEHWSFLAILPKWLKPFECKHYRSHNTGCLAEKASFRRRSSTSSRCSSWIRLAVTRSG